MKIKSYLERLEGKLDRLDERLDESAKVQERHAVSLEEHMRRSEALEEAVAHLRTELAPIKTHVAMWGGVAKAITFVGAGAGAVVGILQVLGKLP